MMAGFLLLVNLWFCLLTAASAARDSQGTEFILGYMENKQWKSQALNDIELFITTISNTPASVTITTPLFNPSWSASVTVSRGNIETVKVPHQIRGVGTEKSNKGVWIQATQEVSVYSVNKEPKSTDAYISLPTDVLGTEYYAMTYTRDAELLVVGTQDNTQVTIKWPSGSGLQVSYGGTTYRNGDTLVLTLNKFETFHALQEDSAADFTGAYVTSNKPISVVSGNKKIAVPLNAGSADHLTEMLMPVDTWGKTFMTTSTPDRSIGDVFRIVASEDGTTVQFAGGTTKTFSKAGDSKDVDISTGNYQSVTADKPVMIAMFTKTFKNDGPYYGDPAMSLLIPEPQYASDYTWSSVKDPTGADFNNKVAVIIKKSKMSGLRLDGNTISWQEQKDITGSNMIHLWTRVTPVSHNIFHTDPSVTFMALASGTFQVNSYAYAAGLRLAQINTVCVPTSTVAGDIVDNDCDGAVDEEALNGVDDDGDGQIDEDLAVPPRIDGAWGNWGGYGSCSVSCGGTGTKTRTRNCDNPAPANNGLDCPGVGSETATCNNGVCVVNGNWGNWGSYGSCGVTCGTGTKTRTRSCDNPPPGNGGAQCSGSSSDTASCSMPTCAINGNWANWGSWGTCSVTCAQGTWSRSRTCTNPAPAHGGNNCAGSGSESTSCNPGPCPIDGNWGNWASWGSCSLTCGGGTKSRSRSCDNPAPLYNGQYCSGSGSDSSSCNTQTCPIDGNWANWGSWGTCSVTCAQGTWSRSRTCTNPAPAHGGSNCGGANSETTSCNPGPCPIDGNWATWSSWGTCSVTCAQGTWSRSRTCTNPAPAHGGSNCGNANSETTSCNPGPCPIDGQWGTWVAWGSCSLTCGGGTKTRSRSCDNPAPLYNGKYCTGSSGDSASCNTHPCPIDGNWATWASWAGCSVTCGQGMWSRSRTCTNPAPDHGGSNCAGVNSETTSCNPRPCPIDGAWSTWQAWSQCSVTCMGIGVRGRIRSCDNPTPMHGGAQCPGPTGETETCDKSLTLCSPGNGWAETVYSMTPGTPVNGGFSAWGQWSACTKTCGSGIRVRTRSCNNPVPQFGGTVCSGDYMEREFCNNVACSGTGGYVQTCPERYFDCANGNTTCVHYLKKCDCTPDCDDGSDEDIDYAGCVASNSICRNNAYTVAPVSFFTLILLALAAILPRCVTWSLPCTR